MLVLGATKLFYAGDLTIEAPTLEGFVIGGDDAFEHILSYATRASWILSAAALGDEPNATGQIPGCAFINGVFTGRFS